MQTFIGAQFLQEEILLEPIPDLGEGVLLITPQSYFFLKKNLHSAAGLPPHYQPLVPTLSYLPAHNLMERVRQFERELNDWLQTHRGNQWRVVLNPALLEIFREFEDRLHQLPKDSPHPLRLLGQLLNRALIGPNTMHLDLHNGCNAKCVYCWFHSPTSDKRFGPDWKKEMMPEKTFYALMDDLAELGGKEDLLFSGKGEPLLHPHIFDYLRYARKLDFQITLFTNGKRLSPEVCDFLVSEGIHRLYISLSAASREIYPYINPAASPADFDQIIKQLDYLSQLKKTSSGKAPEVFLVSVLNTLNISEMQEFAQMAMVRDFELVRFQLLHVQDYNRHLKILPLQFRELQNNLKAIENMLRNSRTRINHNIHTQMNTVDPQTGNWFENRLPELGCSVGYDFSRVWTNGDVSFCCSPKVMGNVAEGGFSRLWRSAETQSLRTAAMHLNENTQKTFPNKTTLLGDHCYSCPNYEGVDFATKRAKSLFPRSFSFGVTKA